MTHKKISRFSKAVLTAYFFVYATLATPATIIYAEELPNKDDLSVQIQQQAQNQTSQIHINPEVQTPTVQPETPQNQTSVENTGDNNSVENNNNNTTSVEVNNQNTADVTQNVTAEANTGGNSASRNICKGAGCVAGSITTGDADVNVTGIVRANNNATKVTLGGNGGVTGSSIANTGDNLTTYTSSNNTLLVSVNNNNTTLINQVANTTANTGNNVADRNIAVGGGTAGAIHTGNASSTTNFLVTANGSVVIVGGDDADGNGPGSHASILVSNTGDENSIANRINDTKFIIVNNNNRAQVSQTCGTPVGREQLLLGESNCAAITGGNHADRNIGTGGDAGVIETGDATVNVTFVAEANNNNTQVNAGNTNGTQTDTHIVNTGDDNSFSNNANSLTGVAVNNNNDARVNQTVNAIADTGNNTADRNICMGDGCKAGYIKTGDAKVNVTLVADVNNNETAVDLGNGGQAAAAGTLDVTNTGDNNTFENNTNNTTTVEVNNNNFMDIVQHVIAKAITGLNNASRGIGQAAGIITTGDAQVTVNESVSGNNNCTTVNANGSTTVQPCPLTLPGITSPNNAPEHNTNTGGTQNPQGSSQGSTSTGGSSSGGSSTGSSSTGGSSVGSVLAAILPATGSTALFILGANLLTLIAGSQLRKAGRRKQV